MKKILLCCYGGGHVQALLPVIKNLRLDKQYEIKIFALTIAGEVLREHHIDYFSYKDLSFPNFETIESLGNQLLTTLSLQRIDLRETVAYLGANMQELIDTYGMEEAKELYEKNGRACFYPLNLMTQLLQDEKPDLVVATNSPRTERAIIEAASNLNIPALCLIDGFAMHESKWIAVPSFGKYVGVISKSVKKNLISLGRPEEDIHIIGNPAFDVFSSPSSPEELKIIKDKLSISEGQKVIMYAPSPEGEKHIFTGKPTDPLLPEKILNHLLTIVQGRNDLFLIIRPHPSQRFDLNALPNNVFYDNGNNLKLMLSLSDLVITLGSTVGVQAQLLGKLLICCNQSVYANDIVYEDFGSVRRIYSLDEMESAIEQKLYKEKFISGKDIGEKPLATENALRLIKQILDSSISF